MEWNEEQKTAIESDKKRILVSAAAGSGKTAVLVARIERLVLEERIPLSSMLIVTFTNAAAAEMRQKIVNALTNRLADERFANGDDAFLRRQLAEVRSAQISTFHAFALAVIREYYFKIGLVPGLRICDEARRNILRNEAAEKLFARRFAEDYDAFTDFLRHYAGEKDESYVREKMLFDVYDAIRVMPDSFDRMREQTAFLAKPAQELFSGDVAEAILREAASEIAKARALCLAARALIERGGAYAYLLFCDADAAGLSALLETAKIGDLQTFLSAVSNFKFARFSVSDKAEKAKYKAVEADVKRLRDMAKRRLRAGVTERYCARPLESYAAEINDTAPYAEYLYGLLVEFHAIFTREKQERGLMDFADAEHYALEILGDEEVAAVYRERFSHIFIDEYQDSNSMQEALVERITGENSIFMVGDVKQSIYKFRLAEPELFLRKYKEYGCGGDEDKQLVNLSLNYRSKAPVINAVNTVFGRLMTQETTEIVYDENAKLRKGLSFENEAEFNAETALYVVDDAVARTAAGGTEAPSSFAGDLARKTFAGDEDAVAETADGEGENDGMQAIKELQRTEIEALAAVRIVKDELYGADGAPPRRFFDTKTKKERGLTLRDIVVLMRGARNQADVFARVFAENDLPAFTDTGVGYFDTVEIETFMNLLRVIDNRRRDIPLLSVMYAPIFGFSTEELMDIRLAAPRASYCDALLACAGADAFTGRAPRPGISARLREKLRDMLARLEAWRENAAFMPLDEFVWALLRESGYYTFAGALPGGAQRQANLRALADKALDFGNTHMRGLSGFIAYVEHIRRKVDVGQVRLIGENEDVLRIMTVHKSKGLEFPVVIVAGLGRRFVSEPAGAVSIHKDVGIALRFTDPARGLYKNTLLQSVIERKREAEAFAEEIRILYVAFTRAMDRLILLGTVKGGLASLKKPGASIDGRSHLELLAPMIEAAGFRVCERSAPPRAATLLEGRLRGDLRLLLSSSADCDPETAAEIERRLGFVYPHEKAAAMKSKYAVTELAALSATKTDGADAAGDARIASQAEPPFVAVAPRFLTGDGRAPGAAERGSLLHRALERMDFRAAREGLSHPGFLEATLDDLVARGVFTPEELAAVDTARLRNFLASDICARAAASPELYKETPFVMRKELDGEEVLVQGVIDCWFVENDAIVLLDYKSGHAFASAPEDREEALRRAVSRYRPQLAAYAEAIERIRGARVSEACLFLLGEGLCLRVELS